MSGKFDAIVNCYYKRLIRLEQSYEGNELEENVLDMLCEVFDEFDPIAAAGLVLAIHKAGQNENCSAPEFYRNTVSKAIKGAENDIYIAMLDDDNESRKGLETFLFLIKGRVG